MKRFSIIFFVASLLTCAVLPTSCVREEIPAEDNDWTTMMTVSFRCESPISTRSSAFSSTVTAINDVNCYIWDRGVCVAHYYLEGEAQSIDHIISTRGEYTFYALANIGRKMEPAVSGWQTDESSMMDITVARNEKRWREFPMAGTAGPVSFSSGNQAVTVTLRRLVARIGFSFSPDDLLKGQNIEVTAVRLRNAAADVHPFATESAASSVFSVDDTASQTDLQLIAENKVAYFYAFENCRGTLFPDNDDPWKKVPENIGSEAALCTYLEVDCKMPGDGVIGGKVTYRFYPGSDNVTNFDVRRNHSYIIRLCATGDGLDRLSWKVDADVSYTNNQLATLRKDGGLHPIDDTYLGEMFSCSLTNIDASVLAYFGGTVADLMQNADLRCIADDGGTDLIEFNGGSESAGSVTRIEGTALRAGNGSVWLCTRDGNLAVPLLQRVTVNRPNLVLSYDICANYPECIDEPPMALINAGMKAIHLYLCDRDGLNLMADVANQYCFSERPYRFSGSLDLGRYEYCRKSDNVEVLLECSYLFDGNQEDVVGQPFASFEYGITLSDNESTWNILPISTLVDACFDTSPPFSITIEDRNQELSASTTAALSYQKVEIEYLNEDNEIEFVNPSNIPLQIRVYEFTFGNALDRNLLPEFGVAYKIPSNVSSALSNTTITPYAAVGYHIPMLYTSPVRTIEVSPKSPSVMVGRDRWLVGQEYLNFKGYKLRDIINTYYSRYAEPSSTTGIAIDIRADGYGNFYRMDNLGVSASQKYPSYDYYGDFSGSAIFSDGQFVCSDIGGCVGCGQACEVNKNDIIYSPSKMITLLKKNAELKTYCTSPSSSSSGKNTNSLIVTLKDAYATDFTFILSLYGEVTVYPKGTFRGSVTHLVGPDSNRAYARIHSGSSSTNYRCVPELKTTHSLSLKSSGTQIGYPVDLYSLITSNLFSLTETDAYTALNGSNSFQHQYHPINFYMSMDVKAQNIADIYKGTFSDRSYSGSTSEDLKSGCFFTNDYYYWNPNYLWNKIDESSTIWNFRCNELNLYGIGYVCVVE